MMRTYPSGMRVDSSNLDPSFAWRQGIQVAALNWQRYDKGMMLNKGMFAGSGGWVLKPSEYRGSAARSSSTSSSPQEQMAAAVNDGGPNGVQASTSVRRKVNLSIEIYAGQNIMAGDGKSNHKSFHPYVACHLHVERPKDSIHATSKDYDSSDPNYKCRTKTCSGADPDFGGQILQFPSAPGILEELSFVRFKIKDDEIGIDDLLAWACIRLDRLRQGFRFIRLFDTNGKPTDGILLVRISKREE
ncbi:hypothetical protein H105_06744 [Trichophyton soudanense CBS 452.61]|uniref:Phosphoinositide phospholipase C n=1 Tax=Trichophyton soudanense CBS 452.61 TaxID=1215331 RepID=A0A022XKD4_TRISD|nr:hypothetical protein H105_06744 [Trichophyton soudanense CBS 452.61]